MSGLSSIPSRLLSSIKAPSSPLVLGLTTTSAAGLLAFFALRPRTPQSTIISPRILLGDLTEKEKDYLPYPPDVLDGRWVDTPYGVMRVYEFGPERGRKVVFVHDNKTPSPVARDLLWELVSRGCRVLTFDLYGSGYSDTPLNAPHDHRLFSSQIIFAISSSTLHWTSFSLIGYSLGGGIAVSFAAHFSQMVDDLILLAPRGILRKGRMSMRLRLAHAGWIPARVAARWLPTTEAGESRIRSDPKDRAVVIDVPAIAEWQQREHAGHFHSLVSCFRHGPAYAREEEWAIVGEYFREADKRVLVVLGNSDKEVDPASIGEMVELLSGGEDDPSRVVGKVIDGGHDLLRMKGRVLGEHVEWFWKNSKEVGWVY